MVYITTYIEILLKMFTDYFYFVEVTDAYTVAHAFTFFLDAFETSAGLLMFSLCELALNHEIQTKARTEIETVLGKYKGELTYEALAECEYLENVAFGKDLILQNNNNNIYFFTFGDR